jgi:hypothetical protein
VIASIAGRFRHLLATILVVKPETVIRWHRAGWQILCLPAPYTPHEAVSVYCGGQLAGWKKNEERAS